MQLAAWLPVRVALVAAAVVGPVALGCRGEASDDDCERVGKALEALWRRETASVAGTAPGGFSYHAGRQGTDLASGFVARCRSSLVGKPLGKGELACVLDARALADLERCAGP
ncbi:MAG: hypothetical protein IT373_22810 [Polyangiaceae bacterium]|nr:hypothetical protein [Polyangiaceae bacterium]